MAFSSIIMLPLLLLFLAIWAGLIYLLILLIRALRKYLLGGEARREKAETRRTLGEVLKAHRMRCQMTQEFVAEALGVSANYISLLARGKKTQVSPTLAKLVEALYGYSAEWVMTGQGPAGGPERLRRQAMERIMQMTAEDLLRLKDFIR